MPRLVTASATLAVALLTACGTSNTKPASDVADFLRDDPQEARPERAEENKAHVPAPKRASSKPSARGDEVPEDWTPSHADCQEAADRYARLVLKEQLAKELSKAKSESAKKAAETAAKSYAKESREEWLRACEPLEGTIQERARWKCAFDSDTSQRFQDCIDGKVE